MVTPEERLKILRMVREGKLTAEEGMQLIEALNTGRDEKAPPPRPTPPPRPGGGTRDTRWFRVRVTDTQSGKSRVDIRLPIHLIQAGLKMGARFSPEVDGRLNPDQILAFIQSGETGSIIDVFDEESSEHVEVFIE